MLCLTKKLNSYFKVLIFYTDTITVKEFLSVQYIHLKKLILGNNDYNRISECLKSRIRYNNTSIYVNSLSYFVLKVNMLLNI